MCMALLSMGMAIPLILSCKPTFSRAAQPLLLMARLIERPENATVLISGLLSKTVTLCPFFLRKIARSEPTNPEPMMAIFLEVCAIIPPGGAIEVKNQKYGNLPDLRPWGPGHGPLWTLPGLKYFLTAPCHPYRGHPAYI